MNSPSSFTVLSTFSGCGGSSLGYQAAGGKIVLAVEIDDNAAATYRLNFPMTPLYHGDIGRLSIEACQVYGIEPGELDVLDGSPPCQGFSTAGKRRFDDPRNSLFREYVRLLRGLRPRLFVMENVSGMVKGKMRLIFAECLRELKASGYCVRARLLNAQYFGVPQGRQRLIFIGVREDFQVEPSFPAPQGPPKTARQALAGVEIDEAERQMLLAAGRKYAAYQQWSHLRPGQGRSDLGYRSGFNTHKQHPGKPAKTIARSDGFVTMHGSMHWAEQRRFTVAEFKRFATFPDDFQFAGTWSDAVQRIGNSVPPKFMQAIAEHLRDAILPSLPQTPSG